MKKKYQHIIIAFFLSLVIVVLQFSLISSWPTIFNKINLALIILIFILFFFGRRHALIMALFVGLGLDLLSFHFFGLYLVTFFFTLLLADWVLTNWLTNRSLYSFLTLMVFVNVVYSVCFYLFLYISQREETAFFIGQKSFWLSFGWGIAWSLLAALLLFNLVAALTSKLKLSFLEKK